MYLTIKRFVPTPPRSRPCLALLNNQRHQSHSEQHLESTKNGYYPEDTESAPKLHKFRMASLDLQRVQRVESGALLQPSKAVYLTSAKSGSQEELKPIDPSSEIFTEMTTNAVEFGSSLDTDSHRSASSIGVGEVGSRTELNRSPSLPSVDEVLEPVATPKHIAESSRTKRQAEFFPDSANATAMSVSSSSPPPISASLKTGNSEEDIHSQFRSLSATQLPSSEAGDSDQQRPLAYKVRARRLAKKTESLPGKFCGHSERLREDRCKSSSPGVGLNLQNLSLEDVHSASKLQIDEIWREVETSTTLSSPHSINQSDDMFLQEKFVSEEDLGATSAAGSREERGNEQAVSPTTLELETSPLRLSSPESSPRYAGSDRLTPLCLTCFSYMYLLEVTLGIFH